MYNLTNLINLTILTILPAFVPTRDALPALASWAADFPYKFSDEENSDSTTHPISRSKEIVDTKSSQKKNPLKYSGLAKEAANISIINAHKEIIFIIQKVGSPSLPVANTLISSPNRA